MAGANGKLNNETQKRICEAIRSGLTFNMSCEYAGIGKSSFYRWLQVGEEAKSGKYKDFYDAVQAAKAETLKDWLDVIRDAATRPNNWQAAAWLAERRFPDDYGRRAVQQHEHSAPGGEPLTFRVEYASPNDSSS